jgi:hypothetical protein
MILYVYEMGCKWIVKNSQSQLIAGQMTGNQAEQFLSRFESAVIRFDASGTDYTLPEAVQRIRQPTIKNDCPMPQIMRQSERVRGRSIE